MSAAKQKALKAIRGMNDLLPSQSDQWLDVEATIAKIVSDYGYKQIRTPIVESTQLFARSIGADTDIVSKEMYTFEDRNGDSLTLRPEGTASCVRAGIEHGLLYNQQQRLWYMGPMFRHERPQKGRYRQFHQLGVECYGWTSADIEAEVIGLAEHLFRALGLQNWRLEINNLGDTETRSRYRLELQKYFGEHFEQLDKDSQNRLESNPLRILDSKSPTTRKIADSAPSIIDFLSPESTQHLADLELYLQALEIPYTINPAMVRGLDYYNDTVFEFICDDFGAQATVCGGGRYDGLVEQLGGPVSPAFGFGLGLERLVQILAEQQDTPSLEKQPSVFIVSDGKAARAQAIVLRSELAESGISSVMAMGDASFKNQFKRADKSGALIALIVGEQEVSSKTVSIKVLRSVEGASVNDQWVKALLDNTGEQVSIPRPSVIDKVTNLLDSL